MLYIEIDDQLIAEDTGDDRAPYCQELAKTISSVAIRLVALTEKPLPSKAGPEAIWNIHGDYLGRWWFDCR